MLSEYVGQDNFLRGVSIYLKKHLYANSVTADLWEGIQEATGEPNLFHWATVILIASRYRCASDDGQLGQEGARTA